ncbi:hypothetical protein ACIGXF_13635 [Streptomyces sp. NPDC053086]|uniref:hypothetical protein n=1 Tax=unclassified Streptomyces TaxID=2593676 RepID=UPI0037D6D69E
MPHATDVAQQLTATGRLLDVHPGAAGTCGAAFARPYTRLLRTTALCAYDAALVALERLPEPPNAP